MIKLNNILNELSINNPVITPGRAREYYIYNIYSKFANGDQAWEEYKELCQSYCKKYGIEGWIGALGGWRKLSQQDRNYLYNQMRRLVHKYGQKEILNELNINKPVYFKDNNDLLNVLNNPKYLWFKKELIEKALENLGANENPNWDYVKKGWIKYKAGYGYDYYNNDFNNRMCDYVYLDDEEEDVLYISISKDLDDIHKDLKLREIYIQGKKLYIKYY